MGLTIRTYVNGNQEFIDLYGDEEVFAEVSFAEINDITKKNSAFTQSFKVPGTKNNNYIFNYFFDINSVYLTWNPIKKFEADLLYDGYEIYNGYVRMENVVITGIEKEYNITFYNGVGDVAANIGDKFMNQLDLSHLSHPFNPDVYLQSQIDFNLFPLTGTTNYSYQNGKTFWGLYNIGYNYVGSLSGVSSYYTGTSTTSISISSGSKLMTCNTSLPFLPGDTIRFTNPTNNYYIQGIVTLVNGVDITFLPNLGLGTGTFNNWNISIQVPEGAFVNDPNTTPILDFQAPSIPNYMSFSGTPVRNYYFKPSIQIKELYEQIFSQAGYQVESNFFNTNYFERYYLPLKFLDSTVYTKGSAQPCYSFLAEENNPLSGVTCNNIPFSANTTSILIPTAYAGTYTFEVLVEVELTFGPCPAFGSYDLYINVNGTDYLVNSTPDCDEYPGTYFVGIGGRVTIDLVGDSVITINPPAGTIRLVNFSIYNAPRFIVGNFDYSAEFPDNDFKQIDFITSVNRMFNFVCIPHPYKPNTIIVEPIIDYIGKGKILDWTDKIDFDSPIQLTPTSSILNGTLLYNFKLDQDYPNQQFNIANNRIFGTYELQLNQDYKDNKISFDTIFGSPVDTTLNNDNLPNLTISNLSTIKTLESKGGASQLQFNPFKILPRVIFRGLVLPNQNWSTQGYTWWAEQYEQDRWQETNRFTTYPFSYNDFSHYINWNASDFFDGEESLFPFQKDMYDVYYNDYITDLTSPENKILKCKAYLTPWEVSQLRFDEKIIVKNSYFRINKISNLSLLEPGLCDLELVKLTKDYTQHAVKYFDLLNCSTGGTDYHTTSDLNYNMYAYVGNYVNIFTGSTTAYTSIGCFEVVEGQYNTGYTYEKVFINSGYTTNGVSVYDNCSCTGATEFIIVQETPVPTPTPSPTPSPTATPTATPTSTPSPTPSATPTATPSPTPSPTATPTPSPTATPTPSPTGINCADCANKWTIVVNATTVVRYYQCNGSLKNQSVTANVPFSQINECTAGQGANINSFSADSGTIISFTYTGDCCPTPSPTPSPTSSATPTATPTATPSPTPVPFDSFLMTIKTDAAGGASPNDEFRLPVVGTNNNFDIDWGDGSPLELWIGNVGTITHTYPAPGTYQLKIDRTLHGIRFANGGDKNKVVSIDKWGDIAWSAMSEAYEGCINMDVVATDAPILTGVTSFLEMFNGCTKLTGNTSFNTWDTSNITNMASMFQRCFPFNQPLSGWNVSNVTTFDGMFNQCTIFNQPLNNWNMSAATNISTMFRSTSFNQPLSGWNVSNVTLMGSTFEFCPFNQNINNWDTSKVTNFRATFWGNNQFNQPLSGWTTSAATTMFGMFWGSSAFNQNINNWNTSKVNNMSLLFNGASSFNQPLSGWTTASATTMDSMFQSAVLFNQPINNWDTSKVTSMTSVFQNAKAFNQELSGWTTSAVTNMNRMFRFTDNFNKNINNWNVSKVTNFGEIFADTSAYNQSISGWTTSSANTMTAMFQNAKVYNQDLANLDIDSVPNGHNFAGFLVGATAFTTENYSRLLISFANQMNTLGKPTGCTMNNGTRTYNNTNYGGSPYSDGAAARAALVSSGWTITDGGQV